MLAGISFAAVAQNSLPGPEQISQWALVAFPDVPPVDAKCPVDQRVSGVGGSGVMATAAPLPDFPRHANLRFCRSAPPRSGVVTITSSSAARVQSASSADDYCSVLP